MIRRLTAFLRRRGVDLETFGTVFDLGSRDALQAVELAGLFPNAEVVTIECNPNTLELCRQNIAQHPRIRLIEKAINSYTGRCPFHPIDSARTITSWPDGNPGASSLFLANGDYPPEQYVQTTVELDCIRLDALCGQLGVDAIDLIWIDLQGAELLALQSAGVLLDKTRYIYTEVSHRPIYRDQCLFEDVDTLLRARGFRCCTTIDRNRWQQDLIYENTRHLIDAMIPLGPHDADTAELCVRSVRTCVSNVRHIYLVGAEDPKIPGTHHIDERAFPFDKETVQRTVGSATRPGWYLQQLLKLYFQDVHRSSLEHVLAVDADTIFLRPCRFIDAGRPVVNFGDRFEPAFFEHMARLCPKLHRMMGYSGITHCLLFTRAWLRELHEAVAAHHSNTPLWEAYLRSIDPAARELGASEAEIYFNFCLMFHAGELTIRRLDWVSAGNLEDLGRRRPDYVSLQRELRDGPIDRLKLEQQIAAALSTA
jgi:FkbM family methyltransferase